MSWEGCPSVARLYGLLSHRNSAIGGIKVKVEIHTCESYYHGYLGVLVYSERVTCSRPMSRNHGAPHTLESGLRNKRSHRSEKPTHCN